MRAPKELRGTFPACSMLDRQSAREKRALTVMRGAMPQQESRSGRKDAVGSTRRHSWLRAFAWFPTSFLIAAVGCATCQDFQSMALVAPRELSTVPQPAYRVAPPDRLFVHVQVSAKPAPQNYAIQPGDTLSLEVTTAPGQAAPIFSAPQVLVAPDGKIRIGQYGELKVAGYDLDQVQEQLKVLLMEHPDLKAEAPRISLQLAFLHESLELLTGDRLVRPDGSLNLSPYGDLFVQGSTLPEVRQKIRAQILRERPDLLPRLDSSDEIYNDVEVTGFNSQVCYVQREVNAPTILPITGQETVLDAVVRAGSVTEFAERNDVYLVRVDPFTAQDGPQVLPVHLRDIVELGDTETNYQLRPGDRIVVPPRRIVAFQRLTGPFLQVADSLATTTLLYQRLIFDFIRGPNPVARSESVAR